MKKLIATILTAIFAATFINPSASAQDGLAVEVGYRGFLPPKLDASHFMHGVAIGVDYAAEELLGPVDLVIGANFNRVWSRYRLQPVKGATEWDENRIMTSTDLEIPVQFRMCFGHGDVVPFIGVGATLGIGLDIKDGSRDNRYSYDLYSTDLGDRTTSKNPADIEKQIINNIIYGKGKNPLGVVYNRFDVLVGGSIGAIFADRIRLKADLGWGCLSRIKSDEFGIAQNQDVNIKDAHNLQLTVSLAYCFD